MNEYTGVVISDVHIGAVEDSRLCKEMQDIFIHDIYQDKHLNFIIIDGDWFDRKFYLNESSSAVAMILMEAICRRMVPVRVVYGTSSHDASQYAVFEHAMTAINPNFKVIYSVCEEELLPGMNVLYIPEEYIEDKKEYYKDYLYSENHYDFIFGHGVIREAMKVAARSVEKQKQRRAKAPVFSSAELANACDGLVLFGHYHINTNIDDKVFYVGSYSRWIHGEEPPKGYYKITMNEDDGTYSFKFIENTMAEPYTTLQYGYEDKIFNSHDEFVKELGKIKAAIDCGVYGHVRLNINIPPNFEATDAMKDIASKWAKDLDSVTVMFGNSSDKEFGSTDSTAEDAEDKFLKQYDFIDDDSLTVEEKVQKFIELKDDRVIPVDHIRDYMTSTKMEEIVSNIKDDKQ